MAPDYVLVDERIKDEFTDAVKRAIVRFYGPDPRKSPYYARIINWSHFERLMGYLDQGDTVVGGQALAQELFIAPTVLDTVDIDAPVMQEEIFGPVLPLIPFTAFPDALKFVNSRPKPLAIYLFTTDRVKQRLAENETSSGSFCVNDVMVQFFSQYLPVGGGSGMEAPRQGRLRHLQPYQEHGEEHPRVRHPLEIRSLPVQASAGEAVHVTACQ